MLLLLLLLQQYQMVSLLLLLPLVLAHWAQLSAGFCAHVTISLGFTFAVLLGRYHAYSYDCNCCAAAAAVAAAALLLPELAYFYDMYTTCGTLYAAVSDVPFTFPAAIVVGAVRRRLLLTLVIYSALSVLYSPTLLSVSLQSLHSECLRASDATGQGYAPTTAAIALGEDIASGEIPIIAATAAAYMTAAAAGLLAGKPTKNTCPSLILWHYTCVKGE
ncbi:hypothetical protein ACSSS7_000735 [Eimeria intestinalis]